MKFTLNKSVLEKAVSIVSKAISSNNTLIILWNILISCEWWKILFSSTNLDISVKYEIKWTIEEEWNCTIPARIFQNFLQLSSDQEIKIETKADDIFIHSSSWKTKIKWMNSKDFPKIENLKTEELKTFSLNMKNFKSAITKTIFSTSFSSSRPVLSWVFFKSENGKIKFSSTDSYRFSSKEMEILENENAWDISLIVPSWILTEVLKIIWDFESISEAFWKENIKITYSNNQLLFSFWDIQIFSRIIEWSFPNCNSLIPKESSSIVEIEKNSFLQWIKRISLFSKENNNKIFFNFWKEKLKIFTEESQIWNDMIEIPATNSWPEIEIAMNWTFVIEILNILKSSTICIKLNGNNLPVLFEDSEDKDFIHILMPLRI